MRQKEIFRKILKFALASRHCNGRHYSYGGSMQRSYRHFYDRMYNVLWEIRGRITAIFRWVGSSKDCMLNRYLLRIGQKKTSLWGSEVKLLFF